jgi:hypothetical protein
MYDSKGLCNWLNDIPLFAGDPAGEDARGLIRLNARLDKDARLGRFSEPLVEGRLSELERIGPTWRVAYALTLARINELALLCAGNCADHGEIEAVGDLLFNPRRILIHIKGMPAPVVKERHMALTEQFAHVAPAREDVIAWLRDEAIVQIEKEALLPHLLNRLRGFQVVSLQYLDSVEERVQKIAELISFLASSRSPEGPDLHQWLAHAATADKQCFESKLCRFDTRLFFELGTTLRQILGLKRPEPLFWGELNAVPAIG